MQSRLEAGGGRNQLMKFKNLGLMRLILAISVVLYHCSTISHFTALSWVPYVFNGHLAVEIFFIISGLLVIPSYERSGGALEYFIRRGARIYPAYFLVIFVTTLTILIYFSLNGVYHYVSVGKYFAWNSLALNFVHPTIEGVFSSNSRATINGALWTIKIEISYYLMAPILCYVERRIGILLANVFLILISLLYRFMVVNFWSSNDGLLHLLPGVLLFFASGRLLYVVMGLGAVRDELWGRFRWLFGGLLILAITSTVWRDFVLIEAIVFSSLIYVAVMLFRDFDYLLAGYDLSYGVYLVHFPIIQVILSVWPRIPPLLLLALSLGAAIVTALLLWTLIERPALDLGKSLSRRMCRRRSNAFR